MTNSARIHHYGWIAASLLMLAACSVRYPLGIQEAQWQTMTTEQRLHAQEKQAELDRVVEERRVVEARAREAESARKQAELDVRRQEARYGDRVQCVLSNAEARLGSKWRKVEPVALDLVQGVEAAFELAEPAEQTWRYRMPAFASFDGQTISLCRDANDGRRRNSACARLLGTLNDYRRGINQILDSSFLRGGLRCDLVPGPGMPKHWK